MPSTNFVPIVGCVPAIMKTEACKLGEIWFQNLKSPISRHFWLFGEERVGIADADLAKQILINKSKIYTKGKENYDILRHLLGNGLVLAEGIVHHKHRKLCNNFFKINSLKNVVSIFEKFSKDLIDVWLTEIHKTHHQTENESFAEFSIEEELTNFTLDVIGKFAFNYDFNSIKHCNHEITENMRNIIGNFEITWGFIIFSLFPYLNTSYAVNYKKQIEKINNTIYSVIQKQREALKELSDEFQVTNLLASLLMAKDEETGDKMDDTQIRDEVMTFMLAGHETTGITLNWCLLEAARHPEMQQKIRDELNSVITHGSSLSYDHLEKLIYTKCFIQETLRMYPAAPALGRQAVEDNYLHGYLIPKGTNVFIDINVIHKNPKYWDEPYEFRPERFFNTSAIYPYSYLPFMAGSRMCIGYKFAMMEMTTVLARLVSNFQFEMIPGVTYTRVQKLTLRPSPSLVLRVREIK